MMKPAAHLLNGVLCLNLQPRLVSLLPFCARSFVRLFLRLLGCFLARPFRAVLF